MEFIDIYNEHKDLVYNLALGYCQNRQDAEEIAQEVFMIVYEKKEQFEGKSSITTWIYRVTINKSLDFLKAKKRKKRSFFFTSGRIDDPDQNIQLPNFDHPGVLMESKEEVSAIFSAINQLPENQKTVIVLLKLEDKSQTETAEIMETSVKAVESLFQRAKKNLKQIFDSLEG